MKRWAVLLLAVILLFGVFLETAPAMALGLGKDNDELSPDVQCPIHPQIYIKARYKDKDRTQAYDLNNGLSAGVITQYLALGNREYGLYFKFTPGGRDKDYVIKRFDFEIFDPSGNKVYTVGHNQEITCKVGYYWAFDFFSLDSMFRKLNAQAGGIPAGSYKMNIYFNRQWTASVSFLVKK